MIQAIQDLIIAGLVTILGSAWSIAWYKIKRDEQSKLYNLRDREMRMQEEASNVRIDYMRELITQDRLELTSDGSIREKKHAN